MRPLKQVPVGFASKQRAPASTFVLGPVVQHVTALAEGGEVAIGVVACDVITMSRSENDPRRSHDVEYVIHTERETDELPLSVTP